MTKITIVCPSILPIPAVLGGAVETIISNIIDYNEKLPKAEIDVISVYEKRAYEKSKTYKYANLNYVKHPVFFYRINSILHNLICNNINIAYFDLLYKKILQCKNNKVIVEGGIDFALYLSSKNKNINIFYHSHGHEFVYLDKEQLNKVNTFERIFVVSEFCLEEAVYNGVLRSKLYLLKNGIRLEDFNQQYTDSEIAQFKEKYNIDDSRKIILFKGRLVKEKGILELIEAVNGLQYKNYCLLICGGKNFARKNLFCSGYERTLKKSIINNSNIKFLGYISYKMVPLLNSVSTLAIVPSRWDDPAPLVAIEAMASGIPLVVSKRGGIPEYVNRNCAVIIEDSNFIPDLRTAIDTILSDDALQENMRLASINRSSNFGFKEYYDNFFRGLLIDE